MKLTRKDLIHELAEHVVELLERDGWIITSSHCWLKLFHEPTKICIYKPKRILGISRVHYTVDWFYDDISFNFKDSFKIFKKMKQKERERNFAKLNSILNDHLNRREKAL